MEKIKAERPGLEVIILTAEERAVVEDISSALQMLVFIVYAWIPVGLFLASLQFLIAVVTNLTHPDIWLSFEIKDGEAADLRV